MAARRELVSWLADYGKILNFTVLKPLVKIGERPDKSKFDVEINEDSGGNADMELLKIMRKIYDDLLASKKKPAISVDGAEDMLEESVIMTTEIPSGFFTVGYFAMKYLVVKAHKGEKDSFMVSYLIAKGAEGMSEGDIVGKSRKDVKEENWSKTEINVTKRTDRLNECERINKSFSRDQMSFHLDMQSAQNEMNMLKNLETIMTKEEYARDMTVLYQRMKVMTSDFASKKEAMTEFN